jgi:hypothetical protein
MPTIRTATDRILATVAAFGHVKDGNYGPYQSVLFESPDLPEGKVWRSMKPEEAKTFDKGQQAYLVPTTNKQGKPSWDIELLPTDQPQAAPMPTATPGNYAAVAPSHQPPASARQAYLENLERVGNRYAACVAKAKQIWGAEYSEEELKGLAEILHSTAATLFIEANRMTR